MAPTNQQGKRKRPPHQEAPKAQLARKRSGTRTAYSD